MDGRPRDVIFFSQEDGTLPVQEWLLSLRKKHSTEHAKLLARIRRAELGSLGDHRMLGGSWGEMRIDYGPGYRIYFGLDGDQLILLLHGGTKKDQQRDIEIAEKRWRNYLDRKEGPQNGK